MRKGKEKKHLIQNTYLSFNQFTKIHLETARGQIQCSKIRNMRLNQIPLFVSVCKSMNREKPKARTKSQSKSILNYLYAQPKPTKSPLSLFVAHASSVQPKFKNNY